jgi:DNA-binding SARP family transcriptional activator
MSVFHALILTIKSYITIGRHDLAEETLLDAVAAGNEVRFYYPIHYELAWFAPFVDRLVRKNPHLKSIWPARPEKKGEEALVLASCSHPLPHSCVSDDANLLDLHVCSFGPFEITANGWKVPLDQCPSKKALTLIKYLFFKRHEGGVSLDEALELLWPEMDPRATRANLRVILSMLRKVFKGTGNGENGLPNLIREDNKISLLLGKSGWADVDEFLGQIRLAGYKEKRGLWEEALIHHEKTVELYRGDFLAEELYADWCYMEREYLRDRFLASLIRMAEGHERLGNYTEAISVLYRALKTDKYREDAYRKLMVLCAKADRKGEIIRVYELCKKAIEDDLNLELSTDTESLYLKLSSNSVDVDLPLHAKQIVFPS